MASPKTANRGAQPYPASRRWTLRWLLLLLMTMTACAPASVPWRDDAYIWQRAWRPSLLAAIQESRDLVSQWRVLAAEAEASGKFVPMAVDWQALRASGRPVVMVVRIDGQLRAPDTDALLARITALRHDWTEAGLPPAGLEIDHDCATPRLSSYARVLTQV